MVRDYPYTYDCTVSVVQRIYIVCSMLYCIYYFIIMTNIGYNWSPAPTFGVLWGGYFFQYYIRSRISLSG